MAINLRRISLAVAVLAFAINGCRDEGSSSDRSARDTHSVDRRAMGAGDAPRPPVVGGVATLTTDQFVMDAVSGGKAEVELSRMAVQKSEDGALKQFAETMINDHGKANSELQALADKEGFKLPAALAPKHKAAVDTIGQQNGVTFDRLYAAQMLKDHQEAVTLFEKAASQDQIDPDLRQFAANTLPTLKQHLEHARQLTKQVGGTAN